MSARDLYQALDIAPLCMVRQCSAWSGVIGFQHAVREEIFSALEFSLMFVCRGLVLAVVTCTPLKLLRIQTNPLRCSFTGLTTPTTSPPSSTSGLPRATGEVPQVPEEHVEGHFMPNLRTAWERYLITAVTRPYVFQVEVWFCDHDRYPRSDISRVVTLPIDPALWKQRLLQAWEDCVDPALEAFFYVVDPMPIGGTPGPCRTHHCCTESASRICVCVDYNHRSWG